MSLVKLTETLKLKIYHNKTGTAGNIEAMSTEMLTVLFNSTSMQWRDGVKILFWDCDGPFGLKLIWKKKMYYEVQRH